MEKIIAIKEMSAGNDTIGEMWKETKIFRPTDTLKDVMNWTRSRGGNDNIILTIAKED